MIISIVINIISNNSIINDIICGTVGDTCIMCIIIIIVIINIHINSTSCNSSIGSIVINTSCIMIDVINISCF